MLFYHENQMRYLLIGGQAVRLEGMPRFSMDTENNNPVRCLSLDDLLESKRKAARSQDLEDLTFLEKKKEFQRS